MMLVAIAQLIVFELANKTMFPTEQLDHMLSNFKRAASIVKHHFRSSKEVTTIKRNKTSSALHPQI